MRWDYINCTVISQHLHLFPFWQIRKIPKQVRNDKQNLHTRRRIPADVGKENRRRTYLRTKRAS